MNVVDQLSQQLEGIPKPSCFGGDGSPEKKTKPPVFATEVFENEKNQKIEDSKPKYTRHSLDLHFDNSADFTNSLRQVIRSHKLLAGSYANEVQDFHQELKDVELKKKSKVEEAVKLILQIGEGFKVREGLRMKMKQEVQRIACLGIEGEKGVEELKEALLV